MRCSYPIVSICWNIAIFLVANLTPAEISTCTSIGQPIRVLPKCLMLSSCLACHGQSRPHAWPTYLQGGWPGFSICLSEPHRVLRSRARGATRTSPSLSAVPCSKLPGIFAAVTSLSSGQTSLRRPAASIPPLSTTSTLSWGLCPHSSGALWELRWTSWAIRLNELSGFRGRKPAGLSLSLICQPTSENIKQHNSSSSSSNSSICARRSRPCCTLWERLTVPRCRSVAPSCGPCGRKEALCRWLASGVTMMMMMM